METATAAATNVVVNGYDLLRADLDALAKRHMELCKQPFITGDNCICRMTGADVHTLALETHMALTDLQDLLTKTRMAASYAERNGH